MRTKSPRTLTRKLAFLGTVAALATLPQVAQAACSGSACNSVSAAATWTPSDKRVSATLTNKDQAREMRLKFCVMVDGRCSSFDLTLPARGTALKSVSVGGTTAPGKIAVEISSAEFSGGAAAAAGASGASGAVNTVDTPFGKVTYFASHRVDPALSKAVAYFVQGRDLYQKLAPRVISLAEAQQKIGSAREIEAEIKKTVTANPILKLEAGYAQGLQRDIDILTETFRLMVTLADNAARNLSVAEKELQAAKDRTAADQLIAQAARERQRVSLLISIINGAITAGGEMKKLATADAAGIAGSAWSFADKVISAFTNGDDLIARAQELEAGAKKLSAEAAAQRFKDAEQMLSSLKAHIVGLQPKLAQYKVAYEKAVKDAQANFDKANQKGKGSFNFANINALIAEARALKTLVAETRQPVNYANVTMGVYGSGTTKKDWMANPAEDMKAIHQIHTTTGWMLTRIDQMQQQVDTLLAKLEETHSQAMKVAGP